MARGLPVFGSMRPADASSQTRSKVSAAAMTTNTSKPRRHVSRRLGSVTVLGLSSSVVMEQL
jgi:hypothetical protein